MTYLYIICLMSGEPLVGAPREKNYLLFQYVQKLAGLPLQSSSQVVEPPKKYGVRRLKFYQKKHLPDEIHQNYSGISEDSILRQGLLCTYSTYSLALKVDFSSLVAARFDQELQLCMCPRQCSRFWKPREREQHHAAGVTWGTCVQQFSVFAHTDATLYLSNVPKNT